VRRPGGARTVAPERSAIIASISVGTGGAADADDLLQDVLIIVIRRLGSLDDPSLFRPWAFRIASREGFRFVRKRRLWHGRHDAETSLNDLPAPDARPSSELLRELLATGTISPASRAVLILHFQEDLPLIEVAAILDIPLGTAKSRLAYGLERLLLGLALGFAGLLWAFYDASNVVRSGTINFIHAVFVILLVWTTLLALVVVLQITAMTKRILRAVELASRK
jgi:RNA polymerase sigma-70 factor (ECF subfamily)